MFYVYVLKSNKDRRLYIGYTNNLKRRIQEHNQGKTFSTAQRGIFSLIYYEAFKSQKDAIVREKQLKQFRSAYGHLKKRIANSLHES
ncbi:MAG: GIY-YIG nuclease family protein [Candidatus Nealsonbacteria bacterium]|nr:GIY-YIG nuclease family protein [Candidatus Nealsonbacteria bacterium]